VPLSYSENFDGVTAPAIPAGWNTDAVWVTNGTQFHSSPNSLRSNDNTNVFKWATYGTADSLNGASLNLSCYVYFPTSATTSQFQYGITYRCNAATMNNTSTRCYAFRVRDNPGNGTGFTALVSISNGTATTILEHANSDGSFAGMGWLWMNAIVTSTSHTLYIQRVSDSFWLNSSGNFLGAFAAAISTTDSTYTTGDYFGVVSLSPFSGGGQSIYYDDFSINTPYTTGSLLRVPMDGLNRYADLHGGMFG